MSPIPKRHALMIRGGVHSFHSILKIVLAKFYEAEAVEDFWRRVEGQIHDYGLCGDAVGGDGKVIREGVGFGDDAFEGLLCTLFSEK